MTTRYVTHTRKDQMGRIIAVGHPGSWWSPRATVDAIRDIEVNLHEYFVPWPEGPTRIRVVMGATGKYLRTDRDNTSRNNLDDLPSF